MKHNTPTASLSNQRNCSICDCYLALHYILNKPRFGCGVGNPKRVCLSWPNDGGRVFEPKTLQAPAFQDMQTGGLPQAVVAVAQRRSQGEGEVSSANDSSTPHGHAVDLWLELQQNWHVEAHRL